VLAVIARKLGGTKTAVPHCMVCHSRPEKEKGRLLLFKVVFWITIYLGEQV